MAAVAFLDRPQTRRTPPSYALPDRTNFATHSSLARRVDVDDSESDDSPPPALRFSKVTQALLAGGPVPTPPAKRDRLLEGHSRSQLASTDRGETETPSRMNGIKIVRSRTSPSIRSGERGQTPLRMVHLGHNESESMKRSVSVSASNSHKPLAKDPTPERSGPYEYVTPGPRFARSMRTRASSDASEDGNILQSGRPLSRHGVQRSGSIQDLKNSVVDASRNHASSQETISRYQTQNRTRNALADGAPLTGSQRVKRATATGSLFKSKPVRRGYRRRESEENASANDEAQGGSASASTYTPQEQSLHGRLGSRSRSGSVNARAPSVDANVVHSQAQDGPAAHSSRPPSRQASIRQSRPQINHGSRPPSRQRSREPSLNRQPSVERLINRPLSHSNQIDEPVAPPEDLRRPASRAEQPVRAQNVYSVERPSAYRSSQHLSTRSKPLMDAGDDQENVPPPTFKRNQVHDFKHLGKTSVLDDEPKKPQRFDETPVPVPAPHADRKVLGAISSNTPHRPAPAPPPKMSVLEAATTTAGAGVTKSKKKRSHIVINGKIFTQMGKIGRGGSSDVFCVMAENYKMFALKRVKLDDCDESAIKGFKGEIDLLKRLTEVERVVRLFDWELHEDKQELVVLMEKGDTDFNRLLTLRLNGADAMLDPAFVRYHWKEMLECVQAIHDHDIVHQDLKPANFLFVQGRLKLIDFGIANAIDTDNTCNVHRDTHVGTPNYMSPESITDTNASRPGEVPRDAAGRPLKKDVRIGKASDVWSLGCILYQMTYGRPPFAHITNQITRIMAITNPRHTIDIPERGVGGAIVPPALRGVLRRCLIRDPEQRPKIPELLADNNLFNNPDGRDDVVLISEHMLGRIIEKVVERCKDSKRGFPTPEELRLYPASFMNRIREMQAVESS